MAEHRFHVGEGVLSDPGSEVTLGGETAHRISRVLRMQPGQRLALFGGQREMECELIEAGNRTHVRLLAELPPEPVRLELTLYHALIRPNRFDWLVEKLTEIGATGIVPVITEHATVRAAEIGAARRERWQRIAVEATEQCGRRRVPTIATPVSFASALEKAEGRIVFAWEGLRSASATKPEAGAAAVSLFVGPEGGWSATEVERARAAGAAFIGLGPNLLRAETAAIAAAALLLLD